MIRVIECLYEFIHGNFDIRYFQHRIACDFANFVEREIGKLFFKCRGISQRNFDKQTSIHFSECGRQTDVKRHAQASADAHLCSSDGKTTFAEIMRGSNKSARDGLMQGPIDRSEERRVGKECRSRWSP